MECGTIVNDDGNGSHKTSEKQFFEEEGDITTTPQRNVAFSYLKMPHSSVIKITITNQASLAKPLSTN